MQRQVAHLAEYLGETDRDVTEGLEPTHAAAGGDVLDTAVTHDESVLVEVDLDGELHPVLPRRDGEASVHLLRDAARDAAGVQHRRNNVAAHLGLELHVAGRVVDCCNGVDPLLELGGEAFHEGEGGDGLRNHVERFDGFWLGRGRHGGRCCVCCLGC